MLIGLGAERVIDYRSQAFEKEVSGVDVVLDSMGGDTQDREDRFEGGVEPREGAGARRGGEKKTKNSFIWQMS